MSEELVKYAEQRASTWGRLSSPPRLLANRENAVLGVRFLNGTQAVMRLHRTGYQSSLAIKAELQWCEELSGAGFPCPKPLRTQCGSLVSEIDNQPAASMVSWVEAEKPEPEEPLTTDYFERLGRLLGWLHRLADQGETVDHSSRPVLDEYGLAGETPVWGRYWENPALTQSQVSQFRAARVAALDWLKGLRQPDIGPIHADAVVENVLQAADGLWLIDFDDYGVGYRLFELGVVLERYWNNPLLGDFLNSLAGGYAESRGVQPNKDDVLRFMALRAMTGVGWIVNRIPQDHPSYHMHIHRALECVDDYFGV